MPSGPSSRRCSPSSAPASSDSRHAGGYLFRELILWEGGSQLDELFDLMRLTSLTYMLGPQKPSECKSTPAMRAQLLDLLPETSRSVPPR